MIQAQAAMRDFTVTIDGTVLACRTVGVEDGRAPELVLLHEGLGSIAQWKDFPEALAAASGLSILVYDRPGHGKSGPAPYRRGADYHRVETERFLAPLLDHLGIGPAILFGHSDGGTIALMHAALRPERTRLVVTEAAHVFVEEETLAGIRAARAAYPNGLKRSLERYHGSGTDAVFDAWTDTWLSPPFRNWSIEGELPGIVAPLLIIQGEQDQYGTMEQVRRIAAGTGGPARPLMLPDCAHAPHFEARDRVLAATREFLAEHQAIQPAIGR